MHDDDFYESLPVLPRFEDVINPSHFTAIPDSWYVAMSDVVNSTEAIAQGKYKEVNAIGAVTIMVALNFSGNFNFPFIFGGDGATIAIPGSMHDHMTAALKSVYNMAQESFGLELRTILVPMTHIRSNGHDVALAKFGVSSYYQQASFQGDGVRFVEQLLKAETIPSEFNPLHSEIVPHADFTGLECRWNEVPNERGEVHALLVEVLVKNPKERMRVLNGIFEKINSIYGSEEEFKPITPDRLALTLSNKKLSVERKIRTYGAGVWNSLKYWTKLRIQWVLGKILMNLGISTKHVNWGTYKSDLASNTDYRKLDDLLRLVLAGSELQRYAIQGYLEELYMQGKVVYGLHHSPSALITCVILNHEKEHIHLVDGSKGGYTEAASMLKKRKSRMA